MMCLPESKFNKWLRLGPEGYLRYELEPLNKDIAYLVVHYNKLDDIVESFNKNVLPIYEKKGFIGMMFEDKENIPEYTQFWNDVESAADRKYDPIADRSLLNKRCSLAVTFILETFKAAIENNKMDNASNELCNIITQLIHGP